MTISGDAAPRYWAYLGYLVALDRLIRREHPTDDDLAESITNSVAFTGMRQTGDCDLADLAQTLRHAWFTELLLFQVGQNPIGLFPYAIPWSMVQAYYAIYPSIRAYFLACGRDVNPTHQSALRAIAGDLVAHGICERFPQPWRSVLTGDPQVKRGFQLVNSPPIDPINLTNPLTSTELTDPWQFYGLFLRTTRLRQLRKSIARWKKDNSRQRIRSDTRNVLVNQLRPTTIFDTIYRLRSRANYQDVDSFLFSGKLATNDTINLHSTICEIVHTTLLVFEILVAKVSTRRWFNQTVEQFVNASSVQSQNIFNPPNSPAERTIGARWKTARNYL